MSQVYRVHNLNTSLSYETIQEAINAPETLNGHTVFVEAGTYYENLVVPKTLSLVGQDRNTTIIDGGRIGNVINVTANNVSIMEFTIRNSGITYYPIDCCIYLFYSSGNIIQNNIIINNRLGLQLEYSDNNTIRNNAITENDDGVYLYSCHSNIIEVNVITNTKATPIWLYESANNMIQRNNIINSSIYGIYLYRSSNNLVQGNTIADTSYGIRLYWYVHDNNFYHNSFINNTVQVDVWGDGIVNTWDDGYPSGGNYWSDYDGVDLYNGPNQDIPGGDGIGDIWYVIDADNIDRYPLIKLEDTTPPFIYVLSPENKTYSVEDVPLTFTVSESTSWIGYSLDRQANETISGNTTLSGLSDGSHSLLVYAKDAAGNIGASETIYFIIDIPTPEPFSLWIIAAIIIVIIVAVLLVYVEKSKKKLKKVKKRNFRVSFMLRPPLFHKS